MAPVFRFFPSRICFAAGVPRKLWSYQTVSPSGPNSWPAISPGTVRLKTSWGWGLLRLMVQMRSTFAHGPFVAVHEEIGVAGGKLHMAEPGVDLMDDVELAGLDIDGEEHVEIVALEGLAEAGPFRFGAPVAGGMGRRKSAARMALLAMTVSFRIDR